MTLPSPCLPLGPKPADRPANTATESKDAKKPASTQNEALGALQTKGSAYLSSPDDSGIRPTEMIVIGSLLDNAYNLGGLSRVSEVFGAQSLYVSNPTTLLPNKDFTSVSVASHSHLPIHALPIKDIPDFLTRKKIEGYTVVGVEQTDRSKILGDEGTVLPAKTVLIMGAEKEGIPALLLGECDLLVEVPQRGVTRSLNVQTAAAAVLFEYARQHKA